MSHDLPSDATRVLRYLVDRLPNITPGSPQTYARYKEVHDALGLTMQGQTYGESLKRQGLEALARWSAEHGYPAITGLVVDGSTFQPGEGFFRVYGRENEDFSWWTDEIAKSKQFPWRTHLNVGASGTTQSQPVLDADFRRFLAGFLKPDPVYLVDWLPKYETATRRIKESIESGALDDALELLWKTQDNSVAHAGQGILAFDAIDRLSGPIKHQIQEIARDPSPENFVRVSESIKQWKDQGLIKWFPALLIARVFASIAPETYHTTVDTPKHDLVIRWMEQHSSFRCPPSPHWAERAAALTAFLGQVEGLKESPLVRNMFPWFVHEQIVRGSDGRPSFIPGYRERPEETNAVIAARVQQIQLRHNALTKRLVEKLEHDFGPNTVGVDRPSGNGGKVDAVLKHPDGEVWLYEIKVTPTASLAVRQAIGQLLEYGFQKGGWNPSRLFVVAEPELDAVTENYIDLLRDKFQLPIEYLQVIAE